MIASGDFRLSFDEKYARDCQPVCGNVQERPESKRLRNCAINNWFDVIAQKKKGENGERGST